MGNLLPPRPPKPRPGPPKPKIAQFRLLGKHHSYFNPKCTYANASEVVKLITRSHDPVLIVETKGGNRFPIHKDKLIPIP